MSKSHLIVFTDLDGTLLDRKTYSWEKAAGAVELLKTNNVPIVFCSSKTRAEQVVYQHQMGICHPLIVENGSAIILPKNYFSPAIMRKHRVLDEGLAIEFGLDAATVRTRLNRIKQRMQLRFRGYTEMTDEELAELTGLSGLELGRARQRDYSETIDANFNETEAELFRQALAAEGLSCVSGGHLLTVTSSECSKGRAVETLTGLYEKRDGKVTLVGLGDSPNDRSMLEKMDVAYQVQCPDGSWHDIQLPEVCRVGIGPQGWQEAISSMMAAAN